IPVHVVFVDLRAFAVALAFGLQLDRLAPFLDGGEEVADSLLGVLFFGNVAGIDRVDVRLDRIEIGEDLGDLDLALAGAFVECDRKSVPAPSLCAPSLAPRLSHRHNPSRLAVCAPYTAGG